MITFKIRFGESDFGNKLYLLFMFSKYLAFCYMLRLDLIKGAKKRWIKTARETLY